MEMFKKFIPFNFLQNIVDLEGVIINRNINKVDYNSHSSNVKRQPLRLNL